VEQQSANDSQKSNKVTSSRSALQQIREKMQAVVAEYSNGDLNASQFNAIYQHYAEKRDIIERMLERNPDSDAWKSVAQQGYTTHLRSQFQANAIHYAVFRRGDSKPLISSGKLSRKTAEQIHMLLRVVFSMKTQRTGLARKSIGNGNWLVMSIGSQALTMVTFSLQPSSIQTAKVRDLHDDFEAANQRALKTGKPSERFVYPQRALLED
jgi:uncharacterized protein YgbK (DUF1537 family)